MLSHDISNYTTLLWQDDNAFNSGRTDTYSFSIRYTNGSQVRVEGNTSAALEDTWQSVGGRFKRNTIAGLDLWVDGTKQTQTQNTDNQALDTGFISLRCGQRTNGTMDGNSTQQHLAMWSKSLSDDEMIALSMGVNPMMIRPNALKFYAPLYGTSDPEPEITGADITGTVTGASFDSRHAPVGRPFAIQHYRPQIPISAAPAPSFTPRMVMNY